MIHLCTCTGGSTSNNNTPSKKRTGPLSCKNCGGKSSINGKSSSSCLLTTVLELTSLISSDFTWTKVSKGCRSSLRRPRSSNTINLTSNSKVLEMPVSESEKLGVSVLGCHFSEKAEHIPIKKRRFLFRASSPPRHQSLEGAERHETSPGKTLNPNATFLPAVASESKTGMSQNDDKSVKKELVKKAKKEPGDDDDFSGISILAAAACSNSLGAEAEGSGIGIVSSITKSLESKENISKSASICKEESNSHTSTKDHIVPNKSTLDNSSSQPSSESAIPAAKDVKFNWDLNTVMDAWEEPLEDKKDNCTKDDSKESGLGRETESVIPSTDTSNVISPVELKSMAHENELNLGSDTNAQRSVVSESAIPVMAESSIPVSKNQTPGIFSKWATRGGQTSCGSDAVDTKLSMDCSLPPGFDHCLDLHSSKENMATESLIPEHEKHDLSLNPVSSLKIGVPSNKVEESIVKMELTSDDVSKATKIELPQPPPPAIRSICDSEARLENEIGNDNSQSDNRGGSGYDSQYEDGELRETIMNAWKGENENVVENKGDELNIGITDSHEPDLTSTVVLPEKMHDTDEVITGSELNEAINNEMNVEGPEIVNQSDEWKMNVSGLDHLLENQRISSSNFTKTRTFTSRKFSYGEQKDGFDPEDVETKGEGSRFYRKGIGGPSTRDVFLSRGRFRVQGCSSKTGDNISSRPERESGAVRSFVRGGRYSPHDRGTGRGSGVWNRSPERKRLPSPTYPGPPFLRSMLEDSGSLDNITNEDDSNRQNNTSTYVTRRQFRSRSPMNREANDFRARLGLRPTGDTGHERFNLGRGRGRGRVGQVRYTRVENEPGPGPRRFHGPPDECDEFVTEYFPRRRRCFSPIERRNTNNYSGSRSPSRPRTRSPVSNFRRRSRSPSFRLRRGRSPRSPRSPNYRHAFEPEYLGPRNGNPSPPPNTRWVRERGPAVFERRGSPPVERERERERFGFYERKPKGNEYYNRSGQPGRFEPGEAGRGRPRYVGNGSDGDRPDNNGYRRGGFVRRYNMDGGQVKRFHYDDDGFGRGFDARDKHALEVHARGNLKSNGTGTGTGTGTDGRFRDFPRRSREDGGEFKRRSREGKDSVETKEEKEPQHIVKDQSNLVDSNEVVVKEHDNAN